jgi:hypothetical protein
MTAFAVAALSSIAVAALARRSGWGWMAPMVLYSVVWSIAIGIHGLRFFPFFDLAGSTWLAIAAAAAAFVGGGFSAQWMRPRAADSGLVDHARLTAVIRLYFVLGLLGAGLFFWQVNQLLGFQAIFSRPIAVHTALANRTIGSAHLFLYYFGVAGAILLGYRVVCLATKPRVLDVMLFGTFLTAMALSTERNHMLWALACWLFMLLSPPTGDSKFGRLAVIGGSIALLAVTFYVGAGRWLGKSAANISNALVIEGGLGDPATPPAIRARLAAAGYVPDIQADVPPTSRMRVILPGGPLHELSVLYMSVAAALPSLDQGVRFHERSYGQLTFRPFVRGLSRLGIIPDTLRLTSYEEVRTPYPANAYTYLYEHVRDFGLAGAIVFPGIFGLVAGWLYLNAAASRSSFWTVWLAMIQGMILWSPFQNRFVLTVSAYLVAVLVAAFAYAHRGHGGRVASSTTQGAVG